MQSLRAARRQCIAMKNAARDVTLRENRRLFRQIDLLEIIDQLQVRTAMRFFQSTKLRSYNGEITVR